MSLDDKTIDEKLSSASPDERKASFQEGESLAVLGYKENSRGIVVFGRCCSNLWPSQQYHTEKDHL